MVEQNGNGHGSDRERRLNGVLAAYLEAAESGRTPDRARLLDEHPDLHEDLAEFFAGCDAIRCLAPGSPGSPALSSRPRRPPAPSAEQSSTPPHGAADPTVLHRHGPPRGTASTGRRPGLRLQAAPPGAPAAGRSFGRYDLLEELGRGGMGVVYRARDRRLGRVVALKMLRDVRLASRVDVSRFQNEVQAVARLDHPGLVPVYEAGEHDGVAFFTMQLIEGGNLSKQIARFQAEPRAAAALVVQVAGAIHHAHQRGVLHRDLKPSNVLLDGDGRPHVTDFGLARSLEDAHELTGTGETVGTPPYMSPEQATGSRDSATVASDVYGLGAVLYTLLAGEPPFSGETPLATLRLVVQFEPRPPRAVNPRVERDLEIICLKALSKEAQARYASAAELAADLRRYLAGEPIRARVAPRRERVWRWIRRNPAPTALAATVLIALLAGGAGLMAHSQRLADVNLRLTDSLDEKEQARMSAVAARDQADHNQRRAEELLYATTIGLAGEALNDRDPRRMIELLNRLRPEPGGRDLRGFEWHYLKRLAGADRITVAEGGEPLYFVTFSPDGTRFATAGKDAIVRLYDAETHQLLDTIETGQLEVNGVAFSPDGRVLASAGDDGTIRLWDLRSPLLPGADAGSRPAPAGEPQPAESEPSRARQLLSIAAHPDEAYQVIFTHDGRRLISCGIDPVIRIWDATTGRPLGTLAGHAHDVEGRRGLVDAIALSPDGRRLASASNDRTAIIWDLRTGAELVMVGDHRAGLTSVAFSPDGRRVATGGKDKAVLVWDVASGAQLFAVDHHDEVLSLAWSPDGRFLVTGDRGGTLSVWPADGARSQSPLRVWHAHRGRAYGLAFQPDGRRLVSVGSDGAVYSWSLEAPPELRQVKLQSNTSAALGGGPLLAAGVGGRVGLWDAATLTFQGEIDLKLPWRSIATSANGRWLAAGRYGGGDAWERYNRIEIWDLHERSLARAWNQGEGPPPLHVCFSPDGNSLALIRKDDHIVQLLDVHTGKITAEFDARQCSHAAFSPDGSQLAVASLNDVIVWDLESRQRIRTLRGHTSTTRAVAYSPDGRWLASASGDRRVILWDAESGTLEHVLLGHRDDVRAVAFAPDGRTLVTAGRDGLVVAWHVATGQKLLELGSFTTICDYVEFSSHGRYLAGLNRDGTLWVLDLAPPGEEPRSG